MGFRKLIKIYFRSMLISLSILSLWMICEYQQFGELQFDRQCDDMVFILYHSVITWLLVDVERVKVDVVQRQGGMIKGKVEPLKVVTVPMQWYGRDSWLMWDKINEIIDYVNQREEAENKLKELESE